MINLEIDIEIPSPSCSFDSFEATLLAREGENVLKENINVENTIWTECMLCSGFILGNNSLKIIDF